MKDSPRGTHDGRPDHVRRFRQARAAGRQGPGGPAAPNADKLLLLQIDVGDEQKQIVAGIRQHYTPEQLVGKLIVVVNNLAPAMLRGETSNGMLLAATSGEKVDRADRRRSRVRASGRRSSKQQQSVSGEARAAMRDRTTCDATWAISRPRRTWSTRCSIRSGRSPRAGPGSSSRPAAAAISSPACSARSAPRETDRHRDPGTVLGHGAVAGRQACPARGSRSSSADLFDLDLRRDLPWHRSGPAAGRRQSALGHHRRAGELASGNAAAASERQGAARARGPDRRSNFDIAEAVWLKLLDELAGGAADDCALVQDLGRARRPRVRPPRRGCRSRDASIHGSTPRAGSAPRWTPACFAVTLGRAGGTPADADPRLRGRSTPIEPRGAWVSAGAG